MSTKKVSVKKVTRKTTRKVKATSKATRTRVNKSPARKRNRRLWLIEGAYLFNSSPERLDFVKLRQRLEMNGKFYAVRYFGSQPKIETYQQRAFHEFLGHQGPSAPDFDVRLYPLKQISCVCPRCHETGYRPITGGIDVAMATAAIAEAKNYDTIVLSTGDGDFVDAVRHIREVLKKRVELVAFNGTISPRLARLCDKVDLIDQYMEQVTRVDSFEQMAS